MKSDDSLRLVLGQPKDVGTSSLQMNLVAPGGLLGQVVLTILVVGTDGDIAEAPSPVMNRIKAALTRTLIKQGKIIH